MEWQTFLGLLFLGGDCVESRSFGLQRTVLGVSTSISHKVSSIVVFVPISSLGAIVP